MLNLNIFFYFFFCFQKMTSILQFLFVMLSFNGKMRISNFVIFFEIFSFVFAWLDKAVLAKKIAVNCDSGMGLMLFKHMMPTEEHCQVEMKPNPNCNRRQLQLLNPSKSIEKEYDFKMNEMGKQLD